MKLKKIQDQLVALLNADQRAQAKEKAALKELLGKLKKKERRLRDKLANCKTEEERKTIATKLAVCHAQREKGLGLLKRIKSKA